MPKLIQWLHIAIIVFLLFGFLASGSLLYFHLTSIPLVIGHWHMNKGECILTQWERRWTGTSAPAERAPNFTQQLFAKCHIHPSDQQVEWITHGLLVLSGSISVGKVLLL